MNHLKRNLGGVVAVLAWSLLTAIPVQAEERPASLKELYGIVAGGHPELKAGKANRDAADLSVNDAYMGFLPRANLIIDQSHERQEVFRTDNPTYQVGSGTYGNSGRTIQVVQPIVDPRVFAQLYSANAVSDRAYANYDSVGQGMIYSLIEAYLTALSSHDAYDVANSEAAAMRKYLDEMSERKVSGLVQSGDVSEVQARLEIARAQRANAAAALIEAFATLERRVGAPVATLAPLAAKIALVPPTPEVDDWVQAARTHNPDLRQLEATARVADANVYSTLATTLPRVEFHYTDTHQETGGSLYGGGATTSERVGLVRLTVPLFNPEGAGYPAFAARQKQKQAEYEHDTKRFQIDEEVRTAFSEALVSTRRAGMLSTAVEAQGLVVNAKQERFRSGLASVTSVLDAERDYYQARRTLLGARYNYLLSMMQLKRLSGDISPTDLEYMDAQLDPASLPVRPVVLVD